MIVGSLFSGAGLLDCGLQQAGVEHAWFVERDEFRRGLLAKRWPGVPIHDDVRTVGSHNLAGVDGIVGGFPCKGASTAGKRTGLAHPETALWAEFFRIVRELRPCYVGIENVANLLAIHDGAVWGTVLGDLASVGYDVAWDCVPASAVGAPHGRDRVFAVARHADRVAGTAGFTRRGAGGALAQPREVKRVVGPDREPQAPADAARLREGGPGEAARPDRQRAREGVDVDWGEYEPAIRRWEAIHGTAPEPLVRGMDDGDAKLRRVRARVDRSRLSALGDGVHVHVGRLLGEALMALYREETAEREAA